MWLIVLAGVGIMALTHIAPAPFLLDAMSGDRAIWHMPRTELPTVYLTFDDGPNPTTTPGPAGRASTRTRPRDVLSDRSPHHGRDDGDRAPHVCGRALYRLTLGKPEIPARVPDDLARTLSGWADPNYLRDRFATVPGVSGRTPAGAAVRCMPR
jgi:hypothetical protein